MKSYLPATVPFQCFLDVEEYSVSRSCVSNLSNLDGGGN